MFPTRLEHHATIGSTMDRARALAAEGAPEGVVVWADEQTAGRGTGGRRWQTPPGTQLAFSLLARPPLAAAHLNRLTMWVGLALHRVVQRLLPTPGAVQLKWPNDLLIAGRKAAGILVEGAFDADRLHYAVIGVGLNVSAAPPDTDVDFPATCLTAQGAVLLDREALLHDILRSLADNYPQTLFLSDLQQRWRSALWWPTAIVSVQTGPERLIGRLTDVTEAGALVLTTESGLHTLETGRLRLAGTDPYNGPEGEPRDV